MRKHGIKLILVLLLLLVSNTQVFAAQPNAVDWQKIISLFPNDQAKYVQQTSDGGYIITGYAGANGVLPTYDAILLKTDINGNVVWSKRYDKGRDDFFFNVIQCPDGSYLLAGHSTSFGLGDNNAWVMKTDSEGNVLWEKNFGGTGDDRFCNVLSTSDGGYFLTGMTTSSGSGNYDFYLVKIDANGNKLFEKTYGGANEDSMLFSGQTSDGGCILAGKTKSYGAGNYDVWLVKIDADGNKEWDKTFGGAGDDIPLDVKQTADTGFIISGTTNSFGAGKGDVYLVKTDKNGVKLWENSFGKADTKEDGISVRQCKSGGYIVCGQRISYLTGTDIIRDRLILRIDSAGNSLWENTYGDNSTDDEGYCIQQTSDGGYISVGATRPMGGHYSMFFVKLKRDFPTDNQISSGDFNSIYLKEDGTVLGWGDNSSGQLGNGTSLASKQPVTVVGLNNVVSVHSKGFHSVALTLDGNLWSWGKNNFGQLGDNSNENKNTPVQVFGISDVKEVACGKYHTLALKNDGTVWSWGMNYFGQLGDNSNTNSSIPVQVSGLQDIVSIAAGDYFSLALKRDGTVWAWGSNQYGQLGSDSTDSKNSPTQINSLSGVIQIAAGGYHALALKSDGSVLAWGSNAFNQLGDGTDVNKLVPTQVTLNNVVSISCGKYQSYAITNDGNAFGWGDNEEGQLGTSKFDTVSVPTLIPGISDVAAISGGEGHAIAVTNSGQLYTWGWNHFGQIGNGTDESSYSPVYIELQ